MSQKSLQIITDKSVHSGCCMYTYVIRVQLVYIPAPPATTASISAFHPRYLPLTPNHRLFQQKTGQRRLGLAFVCIHVCMSSALVSVHPYFVILIFDS